MYVAMIIAATIILFYLDGPGLWKKKQTRDLAVFCVLLTISAALGLAQAMGWAIPSPIGWLQPVFKGITI